MPRHFAFILAAVLSLMALACSAPAKDPATNADSKTTKAPAVNLLDIPVAKADGTTTTLAMLKGRAYVIVNTASQCGFTGQYEDMQALHEQYKDKGVVVVAFPANDYGGQEPGSNEEIQRFCSTKFNVTFPVMGKVSTKGDGIHPLFLALTGEGSPMPGGIKWNFEKFVVNGRGELVDRFRSMTSPTSGGVREAVDKALAASG